MAVRSGNPKYWREIKYRYQLIGSKCSHCDKIYFPHRNICAICNHRELEDYKLPEKGKILTFTVIRHNIPEGYARLAPYIIGIVELSGGVRILSQIVDCEPKDVSINMNVQLTFRRIREDGSEGIVEYGYKFRPTVRR